MRANTELPLISQLNSLQISSSEQSEVVSTARVARKGCLSDVRSMARAEGADYLLNNGKK